jgi:hypothetical protein
VVRGSGENSRRWGVIDVGSNGRIRQVFMASALRGNKVHYNTTAYHPRLPFAVCEWAFFMIVPLATWIWALVRMKITASKYILL